MSHTSARHDPLPARIAALNAAVETTRGHFAPHATRQEKADASRHLLRTAERYERWLNRPVPTAHLNVTAGVVLDQTTGQPTGTVIEGATMQLHDNEQFTLTVDPTDAKGQAVGDTLTWTIDDPSVASLQVSADTLSCLVVAGTVGSATITITDGTLSATEAIDVIAGPVAAIQVVEGPVSVQPAPAPAGN